MKRTIIIICCISASLLLPAQNAVTGIVTDKKGKAIPFATVTTVSGEGTICDSLGCFTLYYSDNKKPNKIIIGALSFIPVTVTKNNYMKIYLTEEQFEINEVTITETLTIENKSTVSTYITSKKEINSLRPRNVAEILQTKAGFTNRSGYQTPLTLRGMSGKKLLVLRDSIRRFSSYPAGYMSHTINVYDLERIETEKSDASVIYGAGAIAGIINLIDNSPFKQNGMNMKLTTGYGSVNNEKNCWHVEAGVMENLH